MIQFQGFFDSAIIFFLPFFACQLYGADIVANENGQVADLWVASVTSFTALIIVVQFNLILKFRYMVWFNVFSLTFGSCFLYFIYMWIGNYPEFSETRFAVLKAHQSSGFYL